MKLITTVTVLAAVATTTTCEARVQRTQDISWWKKSRELNAAENVFVPEGDYVIELKDNKELKSKGFYLTYRNNARRSILSGLFSGAGIGAIVGTHAAWVAGYASFAASTILAPMIAMGTAAAIVAYPFYHLFTKGLLEVTARDPVIFTVEHLKDSQIPNAFRISVKLALTEEQDKAYIAGSRVKKPEKAIIMTAKGGPRYGPEELNVFLQLIFNDGSKRWLAAGDKHNFGTDHHLEINRWHMSEWRLIRKDWGGEHWSKGKVEATA